MAKEDKKSGLKSSFDLAMERLEQQQGKLKPPSEHQKKAIAEVEQETRAAVASLEIMFKQDLLKIQGEGDPEKIRELEARHHAEARKLRAKGEDRKEQIRSGSDA